MLRRNFTVDRAADDGTRYRFVYLAGGRRFQVYQGGLNEVGVFDPTYEHIDEVPATFVTRLDATPLIEAFLGSSEWAEAREWRR